METRGKLVMLVNSVTVRMMFCTIHLRTLYEEFLALPLKLQL